MKTRSYRALPLYLAVLLGCSPGSDGSTVDLAAEEEAIKAVSASWQAFDEARDASGVAGLFAPDGTVAWEQRQPATGREAVEAFMAEAYAFDPGGEGSWGADRHFLASSGDLAAEVGSFQSPSDQGQYMTLFRKIDGEWKVAADMSVGTAPNGGAPDWAATLLAEWYDAFNARDASRLADIYTPDARIRDAVGRSEIMARFESGWASTNETCSGSFDGFELVGPVGVGWGRDTCIVTDPADGSTSTSLSNWLAVYEQQPDGSWLCIRDFGEAVD